MKIGDVIVNNRVWNSNSRRNAVGIVVHIYNQEGKHFARFGPTTGEWQYNNIRIGVIDSDGYEFIWIVRDCESASDL